jgi:sugar lactone lactonase YvrE
MLSVENENPGNRFNDGKCDARGRLWAGTMGKEVRPGQVDRNMGSVFRIGSKTGKNILICWVLIFRL